MKNLISLSFLLIFGACTQSIEEPAATPEVEETAVQEAAISQMSIHLFDLPEGITEEEYIADIEKMNSFFITSGYGKNYTILKVADDSEVEEFRYALVSSYPSAEVYAASHDQGPEYSAFMDEISSKYQGITETEIYRKVYTIN